jgi:ubiquinone biosynthesis protein COQ9
MMHADFYSIHALTHTVTDPITEDPYLPDPTSDSQDHQSHEQRDTNDHRSLIFEEALKLVPEHGWTDYVLSEGARTLGMSGAVGEEGEEGGEMFPRGPAELVDYFEQKCNQSLNEYMEKLANEDQLEGSKLIMAAVKYRLEMLAPYIETWPQVNYNYHGEP